MSKKIDAHIQFNGSTWQGFRTFQPGMPCEYPDHRTCRDLSAKLQDEQDAREKALKDSQTEEQQLKALEDLQKAKGARERELRGAAARLKSDAIRLVQLERAKAVHQAEAWTESAKKALQDRMDYDLEKVEAKKAEAVAAADKAWAEGMARLQDVDWLQVAVAGPADPAGQGGNDEVKQPPVADPGRDPAGGAGPSGS